MLLSIPLACFILSLGIPTGAQEPGSDLFGELYRHSKEVERDLRTLRADFVEITESDLLLEPIVARGELIASVPMRILMRYREPEKKALLLDGDQVRLLSFERHEDITIPIGDIQNAVDKYFHRASEKELRDHFDVRASPDPERAGIQRIEMTAKRKQIRKGLERLEIWVDQTTMFMVRMRMVFPGGVGSKTIEFSNLRVNAPVSDDDFRLDLDPPVPPRRDPRGSRGAVYRFSEPMQPLITRYTR